MKPNARNRVTNKGITKNLREVFETLILKEGHEPRLSIVCCFTFAGILYTT